MSVKITVSGEVVTAYLDGEIDHHTASVMRNEIDAAVEKNIPTMLVLDFRDVSFMDSSGLAVVMGRRTLMSRLDGAVQLRHLNGNIKRIFEMAYAHIDDNIT